MLLCQVEAFYLATRGLANVCNGLISDDDDDDEVVVGGRVFSCLRICTLDAGCKRVGLGC